MLLGKDHWMNLAQKLLEEEVKKERINKVAKNVILFLGDGITSNNSKLYHNQ